MFKKTCSFMILSFVVISSFLFAEIQYDIQDIGTLQTHLSQAIALNNQGKILGWYNIDGSANGKHFFVRDRDGTFSELPIKENGVGCEINWRYLTDDGKAYGTFDGNTNFAVLYVWDRKNGVIKLGNLPGKEIATINNVGQVLIKSMVENENGKTIRRPVIWENGNITKLRGLEGDLGIESEESYGFDMNNKGEVVGQSLVYLSYKNNIYKQTHAVKWTNGQAIDLHNIIPKTEKSYAISINDIGDLLIQSTIGHLSFIGANGTYHLDNHTITKLNSIGYNYNDDSIKDKNGNFVTHLGILNKKIENDANSIWMKFTKIISVNDNGEILAEGKTIYGEQHVMFLTPVKSN